MATSGGAALPFKADVVQVLAEVGLAFFNAVFLWDFRCWNSFLVSRRCVSKSLPGTVAFERPRHHADQVVR